MKAVVGMLAFGFGYALMYYGIIMYRVYDSTNPADTPGTPLSVLLGFSQGNTIGSPSTNGSKQGFATPPFQGWSS